MPSKGQLETKIQIFSTEDHIQMLAVCYVILIQTTFLPQSLVSLWWKLYHYGMIPLIKKDGS